MLDCPPLLGPLSTTPISTFVIFLNLSSVNLGSLVCACESVVNHGPTSYSTSHLWSQSYQDVQTQTQFSGSFLKLL